MYGYYSGSYHILSTDYIYISYTEFGTRVWIRVDGSAIVLEKSTCSFTRNFSIYPNGRRLTFSADSGPITNDLNVLVDYTIFNESGYENPSERLTIMLNAGVIEVNSSNIVSNPGDNISINNISFTPAISSGYTLYVNGYSGNEESY